MKARLVLILTTIALVLSACGSNGDTSSGASPTGGMSGMSGPGNAGASFVFGEPGDPNMVDRTIKIDQLDTFRFAPATVEVKAGETLRFVVSNQGATDHEFVIGDMALQDRHESEMVSEVGAMMANKPNAVTLAPGQLIEVFWRFTNAGTFSYGCHISGHFAAGMKGEIKVT